MTHLNDLSKAYLEQIAEKKKDDTYLEPDMKKRQANNEKARKDLMKGPQMKNPHFEEKQLDPVGQEDADVDNDGKMNTKTDKYLKKRRKAIGKAMKKESFVTSDWRQEISEVMNDIDSAPIKEKKGIKNKVVINPKMSEAVEEIGGTLIEEIEVEDLGEVIECVYGELIEEGYSEDEIESAIEQALTEATVTVGHDTEAPTRERTRDKLKKKAKGFLGKVAVKAYNKAREAKAAATPTVQRAKTSAKRGIRKMAQKVVDRMSEEVIGEAVYGGTPKKAEDKRMTVTNADKKGNTPAYQAYKAGDKRYKAADHMKEGVRDVDPEKGTAERKARLEKKRGMKLDDHPEYKKEEVENVDEMIDPKGAARIDAAKKKNKVDVFAYDRKLQAQGKLKGKKLPPPPTNEEVEQVVELYKGKHGQTDKQYADSRSQGGKMVSGDSKMSGAEYTHGRRVKAANPGMQPDVGGKTKPKSQGKMDKGTRADLEYRKANLKKEEASMSPQEVQLQKKKAMIDKMIATKRMQGLKKSASAEPAKAMGEETEDSLRDRRMERGGVDGNTNYRKPAPKFAPGPSKKKYDGMSAVDAVKADIRAKYGKGAIIDKKKK